MAKIVLFVCGLIVGAVGMFGGLAYLRERNRAAGEEAIIFADKVYFSGGELAVGISGTLTGDGVAYKNNTYSIYCHKEMMLCWIASVDQIGSRHVGRMEGPYSYPIIKWNEYEVVAEEESLGCLKTTITISRKHESALWVQQPINVTLPICKNTDTKLYKWTIEASPEWKRVFNR